MCAKFFIWAYVLEVDLEYPKELHKLHNDYSLPPNKLEMKKKKIPDDCNISVGNAKKLVITFSTEKYVLHLRLWLKILKNTKCIRIWWIKMAKTIHQI